MAPSIARMPRPQGRSRGWSCFRYSPEFRRHVNRATLLNFSRPPAKRSCAEGRSRSGGRFGWGAFSPPIAQATVSEIGRALLKCSNRVGPGKASGMLTGVTNFRDFGGYPTRDARRVPPGLYFDRLTLQMPRRRDIEKIATLGISVVVDLQRTSLAPATSDRSLDQRLLDDQRRSCRRRSLGSFLAIA